jgi:hypothetical protein
MSWPFYETAPAHCGGNFGPSTKQTQPVLAVLMPVLQNEPSPFLRSVCPFYKTTPARFCGRYARSQERPPPVLIVISAVRCIRLNGRCSKLSWGLIFKVCFVCCIWMCSSIICMSSSMWKMQDQTQFIRTSATAEGLELHETYLISRTGTY